MVYCLVDRGNEPHPHPQALLLLASWLVFFLCGKAGLCALTGHYSFSLLTKLPASVAVFSFFVCVCLCVFACACVCVRFSSGPTHV